MFEQLRESLRSLTDRLTPEEQRHATASMREALMHAKLALTDLREALHATEARLQAEQTELETVRRRQGYAAQINDEETVAIAERFAAQHAERVAVLESKRMVQQQELSLAEREYDDMSAQMRRAMSGFAPGTASGAPSPEAAARREVDALLSDDSSGADAHTHDADDAAPVRRTRAEKEADAESRLAELKRRMGK